MSTRIELVSHSMTLRPISADAKTLQSVFEEVRTSVSAHRPSARCRTRAVMWNAKRYTSLVMSSSGKTFMSANYFREFLTPSGACFCHSLIQFPIMVGIAFPCTSVFNRSPSQRQPTRATPNRVVLRAHSTRDHPSNRCSTRKSYWQPNPMSLDVDNTTPISYTVVPAGMAYVLARV